VPNIAFIESASAPQVYFETVGKTLELVIFDVESVPIGIHSEDMGDAAETGEFETSQRIGQPRPRSLGMVFVTDDHGVQRDPRERDRQAAFVVNTSHETILASIDDENQVTVLFGSRT